MEQKNIKLFNLIELVMENDLSALEEIHRKFKPIILKYSTLLDLSVDEVQSEFDLILIKIYKVNIINEFRILKYIKTSFKNLKKKNNFVINLDEPFCMLDSNLIFFDIIDNLDDEIKKIFKLRFLDNYKLSEIGEIYGVSRQCIDKKIKRELKKISI